VHDSLRRNALIVAVALLAGCNSVDRPRIVGEDSEDEVVSLPGGGALILRRLAAREPQCWVRARGFHGLVPMDCSLAETARP
jgi:hypothetical protein